MEKASLEERLHNKLEEWAPLSYYVIPGAFFSAARRDVQEGGLPKKGTYAVATVCELGKLVSYSVFGYCIYMGSQMLG